MATDPVCGMMVDEASALHAEREGQTFYFCSEHCRQKFLGIPNSEFRTPNSAKLSSNAKYFCPMCPGVESDRPGDCPKCGMALESQMASAGLEDNVKRKRKGENRTLGQGAIEVHADQVGSHAVRERRY